MNYRLMHFLVCPACGQALELTVSREQPVARSPWSPAEKCSPCAFARQHAAEAGNCRACSQRDIVDGTLTCGCGAAYAVRGGIPLMAADAAAGADGMRETQQRFGYEWTRYPACFAEEERRIFFDETQLEPSELSGRLVFDAGCGMGRFTRVAGDCGAEVIGVDLSESVYRAAELTGPMANVHILQADLMRLPLRAGTFDIIYSLGVLHHTPDTAKAFAALVPLLKHGGILSVWVYGTAGRFADFRTNPLRPDRRRFVRSAFGQRLYWLLVRLRETCSNGMRRITVRLPHRPLYLLCYALALAGKVPALKYLTFSVHPHWRVRLLENFDWLAPPFQFHHTKEELLSWCSREGIAVERMLEHGFIPKVGIRGRKRSGR